MTWGYTGIRRSINRGHKLAKATRSQRERGTDNTQQHTAHYRAFAVLYTSPVPCRRACISRRQASLRPTVSAFILSQSRRHPVCPRLPPRPRGRRCSHPSRYGISSSHSQVKDRGGEVWCKPLEDRGGVVLHRGFIDKSRSGSSWTIASYCVARR